MRELSPYVSEDTRHNGLAHSPVAPTYDRSESAGIGLADCWKIIRARCRLIVALVVFAVLATAIIVFNMSPRYLATATLLIDPEPPHLLDVASLLERMQSHDEDDYAKTQFALLQSDQVVARVIRDLDLEANPAFASPPNLLDRLFSVFVAHRPSRYKDRMGVSTSAIRNYLSHFKVMPDNGTRLVKVSFDSPDPQLAARIVNAHVQAYLSENRSLQSQNGEAARAFLEQELVRIKAQVQKSEAALNSYRDRTGILAFGENDQEHNEVAQQRMEDLDKALTDAEDQRINSESAMELVDAGDYDSLPDVVNNLLIQNLKPQVDQLESHYAEMSAKYNPTYPPLAETKARLADARGRLNQEMSAIARATKRRYKAAVSREAELEQKVNEERQLDFKHNDASLQDAVLAREVEANREIYASVLKRMQEVGVNGAAPVSNIAVVEDAIPPPIASIPQKSKSLGLAALSSALIGIALAFMFDQFDDRFKNANEIQSYLNHPELGLLPDFTKLPGRRKVLSINDGLSLICSSANSDRVSAPGHARALDMLEAYKDIRTALLYSRAGSAPKTVLFVSALTGEGKTITAAGTALAFAQTGARTLLIDGDLRRPRCHSVFVVNNSLGLSEVLVGRVRVDEAVHRLDQWSGDNYQGLFLLNAGGAVPNPGELLTSTGMSGLVRQFSNDFDFVMIDSSPILSATDTVGLATMVDGVVIVASIDTPKQTVRAICIRLSNAGAKILGVVINRVDLRRGSFSDLSRHYGQYTSYEASSRRSREVTL